MPLPVTSRQDTREALATVLSAKLSGTATVFDHQVTSWDNISPIVRIFTRGIERPDTEAVGLVVQTRVYMTAQVWVIFGDESTGWASDSAEDTLDAIELLITEAVAENILNPNWTFIRREGSTFITALRVGSLLWLVEDHPIIVEVHT